MLLYYSDDMRCGMLKKVLFHIKLNIVKNSQSVKIIYIHWQR